jgi:hypothetical protein
MLKIYFLSWPLVPQKGATLRLVTTFIQNDQNATLSQDYALSHTSYCMILFIIVKDSP